MDSIFNAYSSAKENAIRGDFIDRLHSRYTVILLSAIIILLGIKQSDGDTIQCWLPPTFSDEQSEYSHQLCWVNNTYHYPDQHDADKFSQSPKLVIKYYQFILFILFIQTLLFSMPTYLWSFMSSSSGGYIKKLLDQTQKSKVIEKLVELEKEKIKKKEKEQEKEQEKQELNKKINQLRYMAGDRSAVVEEKPESKQEEEAKLVVPEIEKEFMSAFKSLNRAVIEEDGPAEVKPLLRTSTDTTVSSKKSPFYRNLSKGVGRVLSGMKPISGLKNLVFHYLSLKVLNLVNVLGQIFFLHYFVFERHFFTYGIEFVIKLLKNENPFYLTDIFPIVTYCDFYVHQNLRQIHWYTSQCILSINIFIEKLFMVIWFWLFLLAFITLFNIFSWMIELTKSNKVTFLWKYLFIHHNIYKRGSGGHHKPSIHSKDQIEMASFDAQSTNSATVHFSPNIPINMKEVSEFYDHYLQTNGVLMLHMIKSVAGEIVLMDLLVVLWEDFRKPLATQIQNDTSSVEASSADHTLDHEQV